MPLTPGTRLGPYEITTPLGAGGMGEVYRAKDTRLGREVAIKILPGHLSADPAARARFEREARSVSSLNHPHVCTLHDVGREGDTDFLVLELLEGETLAARIARGPLPTADVLRIGAQIADALDRAHRAGVIHRDLKPGNVMLTKAGAKLLDFGLARPAAITTAPGSSSVTMTVDSPSPTLSPPMTAEGMIVGTFQYMAPEQLEGAEADARSDLWALGCVLHEMATGRPAFTAKSAASLISAILSSQPPPVSQVAPLSPPALDRLVTACLAKDPADRVQSAHDVKLQLQWMGEGALSSSAAGVALPAGAVEAAARARRVATWWPRAALAVGVLGLAAGAFALARPPAARRGATVLDVPLPRDMELVAFTTAAGISPDGRTVVALGKRVGEPIRLWKWRLDSATPAVMPGTEDTFYPAWSPDGRSIAFSGTGGVGLERMEIDGTSSTRLCAMSDCRGITWGSKDMIVFAPAASGPLMKVRATGGTPEPATALDALRGEAAHRYPVFLPDGEHFLYTVLPAGPRGFAVYAGALGSSKVTHVMDAESAPIYAHPGYLVFKADRSIVAQRFEAGAMRVSGPRMAIAEAPAETDLTGEPVAMASAGGQLLYSSLPPPSARLEWWGRNGVSLGTVAVPPGDWFVRALSSDQRFALATRERDLWRIELERGVVSRLRRSVVENIGLSPDDRRVALDRSSQGDDRIAIVATDGGAVLDTIPTVHSLFQQVESWSGDGSSILVSILGPRETQAEDSGWDLWILPLDGGPPRPYLATPAIERFARVSPDGRWAFCSSTADGKLELFVDSYPVPGRRVQITSQEPDRRFRMGWGRGGREVYYSDPENWIVAVPLEPAGEGLRAGRPERLFRLPADFPSLKTVDGERFLVAVQSGVLPGMRLRVVDQWTALLRK
jgi:hypothetical protein